MSSAFRSTLLLWTERQHTSGPGTLYCWQLEPSKSVPLQPGTYAMPLYRFARGEHDYYASESSGGATLLAKPHQALLSTFSAAAAAAQTMRSLAGLRARTRPKMSTPQKMLTRVGLQASHTAQADHGLFTATVQGEFHVTGCMCSQETCLWGSWLENCPVRKPSGSPM